MEGPIQRSADELLKRATARTRYSCRRSPGGVWGRGSLLDHPLSQRASHSNNDQSGVLETKKIAISAIGCSVIALVSTGAFAGLKTTNAPVTITNNADGTRTVSGDMGFVRNTADNVQHHGCFHRGDTGGEMVVCQSRTSAGVSTICSTSDARMIRVVDGMDSDSTLTYVISAAGSACNAIVAQTRSQAAPK
jgi:hypothetical protein